MSNNIYIHDNDIPDYSYKSSGSTDPVRDMAMNNLATALNAQNEYLSGAKSSADLSSYRTPGGSLSSEGFEAWLKANYPNLPDHFKNLLYNAFSQYSGQHFSPNLWQAIEEGLGFDSSRQNFENSRFTTLTNDITAVLNGLHTEEYNDPINEVARRKAAGINDDISGGSSIGSGTAGEAKSSENDTAALNDMQSSVQDFASGVVNGFINVFTTTMSLAEKFQGLSLGQSRLAAEELSGVGSAREFLLNSILDQIPSDIFTTPDALDGDEDSEFRFARLVSDALDTAKGSFYRFSPKTRKYLESASYSLSSVKGLRAKTLYEELYNKYLTARQGNVNIRGDYRFSEDFGKWVSNSTEYISKHIKNLLTLEDLDVSIKSNEKEFSKYRADKIKSMDQVFSGVANMIPKDASWRGFAEMLIELLRLSSTQKLFGM